MTRRKPKRYQLEQAKRRNQETISRLSLAELREDDDIIQVLRAVEIWIQEQIDDIAQATRNPDIIKDFLSTLNRDREP